MRRTPLSPSKGPANLTKMPLTPEAKKLLAETIRGTQQDPEKGLRARLLRAIHDEADRGYRLSVPLQDAGLDEAHRRRRERIEAWIDERARATPSPAGTARAPVKSNAELRTTEERLLGQAEKEAAATFLNRIVLLRHLEALGLSKPAVLTGGWNSKGYREFREFAPTLCTNGTTDATEGYSTLLQLLFDELALELPGLFGDVGLTRLFPLPAATLREVIERLDDPELGSAWTDDTTLGWVYQYWNDPDREALDAKINGGGKIAPHEIASKTQMFTERYMVEWLLQNSLGLTWLCMCKKHGWTADAERVLPVLEARRVDWRKQREAGEVALDALMPIEGELEEHWKYYVPQPLPDDAVEKAPESVRAIKLLDPACGSGHFLVIAFGLLAALYREEARHRGEALSDWEIAESILEHNLHGIDIDPRAIQLAAAGLYLKAKGFAKECRPKRVNLVAPVLQLGSLPADDPAITALQRDLKREVGIPEELTGKLLSALAGVDYLGSLLKVDAAVNEALRSVELEFERSHGQGDLFGGFPAQQVKLSIGEAKATILDRLERFLAKHSTSQDLGLRLDGEQLAAGVRFVRMAKEGSYDVVVGNPPYHGVGKIVGLEGYSATYPAGRADLFAGFYLRGIELARKGGIVAQITLSNWMYLSVFEAFRKAMRRESLLMLADLGKAAFTTGGTLISTTCAVFRRGGSSTPSIALRPHSPEEVVRDDGQPGRTQAALLLQRGRYEFDPRGFEVIEGEPIVYWWSKEFLAKYAAAPKLCDLANVRLGISTADNVRFLRRPWELPPSGIEAIDSGFFRATSENWVPLIKGADGKTWFEPLSQMVSWRNDGLELWSNPAAAMRSPQLFFRRGVAFTPIGAEFGARIHRFESIMDATGRSVFGENLNELLLAMNASVARRVMASFNPTVSFTAGDVERLPLFSLESTDTVVATIEQAFSEHESAREPSVEFKKPAPSPWGYAQNWAQRSIDRAPGDVLAAWCPVHDAPLPVGYLSFAVGVALGRFGKDGAGVLFAPHVTAIANGCLFVTSEGADSLDHGSCAPVLKSWTEHGTIIGSGDDLRTYLRKSFFDYHKKLYENRPIYLPLSSAKRNFVAFISIHRWQDDTLNVLLADHLVPAKRRLEGELDDMRAARASGNNKGKAEKRFTEVQKLLEELNLFITEVTELAEKGPRPPDEKTPKREVDARFIMDLDDGVMVNSAALWPLLEPQWKEPKKWWKELATSQGKKDYDWSHLAARYFPTRVRAKCHEDPSLGVAHKCFWELHPAKAYAWEQRLQDEIRSDFSIDEPGSDAARAKFLDAHAQEAADIRANELKRRARRAAKVEGDASAEPLFDATDNEGEEAADD